MADYFCPTVIQQAIPLADMTALERLVLTRIFEFRAGRRRILFLRRDRTDDLLCVPAATSKPPSPHRRASQARFATRIAERMPDLGDAANDVEIDAQRHVL